MDYEEEPLGALRRGIRRFSPAGKALGAGQTETKDQQYWDFVTVATGFSEAQFFAVPLGQGATPKKKGDTNLTTASQITDGDAYHIHGFAFGIRDSGAAPLPVTEVNKIVWNGMLEFSISGRIQFQAHLSTLGWGGGIDYTPDSGSVGTGTYTSLGFPAREAFYKLRNVIVLPKAVTFEVKCYWNAAITLAASREIGVRMEGRLVWPRIGA